MSLNSHMFDVTVVGHFSIDSILLPDRKTPFILLGGSAAYVPLVIRRLNGKVSVISKIGRDFPNSYLKWLNQEGIDLSSVIRTEATRTTSFELEYSNDLSSRTLQVKSLAPPIAVDDLPKYLSTKAIHIAPIAGEINYEVIEKLESYTDFLSFDPQGAVRKLKKKKVTIGSIVDKRIFSLIKIFKSSSEEITAITGLSDLHSAIKTIHDYGVKIVIVTLGLKGSIISAEETTFNIPIYETRKTVDPTGAGDAFIGGFLLERIRGKDLLWCACVGAGVSSIVVEALGSKFFEKEEEIYRRANLLYEKEIKG